MRRSTMILLLGITLFALPSADAQTITTVAGGGPNNVQATLANIASPYGVAVDSSGNRFVADNQSARVFKVDVQGVLTVYAGKGASGYTGDGGPATSALICNPVGVAVDGNGNLFIADVCNVIRRVDALTHVIITYAGTTDASGYSGDGGPASSARLNRPFGLAVDSGGNLFIADSSNNVIRRVDGSSQIITTYAGNGTLGYSGDGGAATVAQLVNPLWVASDKSGNLFIADGNNVIRRVDATTKIISTYAGNFSLGGGYSGDGGPATSAQFYFPYGIALDGSGNLFVADNVNNVIRRVDGTTQFISTYAGNGTSGFSGDGGAATSAQLCSPVGVALDGSGNLFVADNCNFVIRRVDANAKFISTDAGNRTVGFSGDGGPATDASLFYPRATVIDSAGNTFIADSGNNRIRRVDAITKTITTYAGNGTSGHTGDNGPATSAELCSPSGVALDGNGNLFVADSCNSVIRRIDSTQSISTYAGIGTYGYSGDGGPATLGSLGCPPGVAVDGNGNLFIADSCNNTVRRIDASTQIITTYAGNGTSGYSGDGGPATSATLCSPNGVAVDGSGNVFIADQCNHVIRRVDSVTQIITTYAGNGTSGYSGDDGPATSAQLCVPYGVAVQGSSDLFIADWCAAVIRRVDAKTKTISPYAGNGMFGSSGDGGLATSASLAGPFGVALDANNNLLIADLSDHRIRLVTPGSAITSPNSATFTVGAPGSFTVTATGSPTPTLSVSIGALPAGVTFADNGNGTATLSGTPALGTVGTYSVTLMANNGIASPATQDFALTVTKASTTVTWPTPAPITYPTPLDATQLNATANVPGTFTYAPPSGAVLGPGSQTLSVTFTPADSADYNDSTASVTLTVNQGTPVVTWTAPSPIAYPTPLGKTQLNATANVPGTFSYVPAAGTVLSPGTQTLLVFFNPSDSTDYTSVIAGTTLIVTVYTVTDLGVLPGGTNSYAYAINALGQITGNSDGTGFGGHAFLYSRSTGMVDIGGWFGFGINSSGQVTGYAGFPTGVHAFLYSSGSMSDLGTLAGTPTSIGFGINDSGQVTGSSGTGGALGGPGGSPITHPSQAFIYSSGMTGLPFVPGYTDSQGNGINATGQITGAVSAPTTSNSGPSHAFVYTPGVGVTLIPGVSEGSTGTAINDSGQVAGYTSIPGCSGCSGTASFVYTPATGVTQFIYPLPGQDLSLAYGINNSGWVVGTSFFPTAFRAFLHTSTGLLDLNSMIPSNSGWILERATAVNDSGWITGWGRVSNGDEHAFLLAPGLNITSASSASFTVGTPGSFTVTTSGVPTPVLTAAGALPGGVTFTDNGDGTATLAGTPSPGTAGSYSLKLTAHNGVVPDATQPFTLTVNPPAVRPVFTSATTATFTTPTAGSFTVTTTGSPTPTLTETGALPGGVTFADTGTGSAILSGTPVAGSGGTYPITITATNTGGTTTQSFTLTVNQAPAITSANATTFIVGTIGTFTAVATGFPAPMLSESGTLPGGVSFNAGVLNGSPTPGDDGTYSITITASNGVSPDATQKFTLTVNETPTITSSNNATFTAGKTGSFSLTASGFPSPILGESAALPSGVTFNPTTGVLSGTPGTGTGGTYSLNFTANNTVGSAAQGFTLTVTEAPTITSASNATFITGAAGMFTVTATGFPKPVLSETGALPSGVNFNASTGVVSGTPGPSTAGTYNVTFSASNGVGTPATQTITLTVNNTPTGTSISVQPSDTTTGKSPVTLTFGTVTQGGVTSLTTSSTGLAAPTGFALGSPAEYFNLATTAVFSGTISMCINYTGITFTGLPQLFHNNGSAWVNVTTSVDTLNRIVCGTVTSLSPFALFAPLPPLTITANPASRLYGLTDPSFSVSYSGFLNGDGPSSLSGTLSCASNSTPSSPVGSYTITCSGLTSAKYVITFAPGILTVTPASLTVTAANAQRVYGAANPVFTGTMIGILNGDNITASYNTAATPTSPVGTYAIVPMLSDPGNKLGNYTVTVNSGKLTVNQAATTTALSAAPNPSSFGQSVTLTATVAPVAPGTGTPTGKVTFLDGTATLGTSALSSADTATLTTSSLAAGNHSLTATYSADSNFKASSSSPVAQQVVCGVLINLSPSTVPLGGKITVTGKVISCANVTQTVIIQFTLSGPSQPSSCSSSKTVMFKTPPFPLAPKISQTFSFPFQIPSRICPGIYTITAATLVNGVAVNTSTASLTVTAH
jgi:probable HAF family extracellular repeat protein